MRAMIPLTVVLLAATSLPAIEGARAHSRLYIPLAERAMTDVRGTNPGNSVTPADVCAAQNVVPNTGVQTKGDCESAAGPTFPFGKCVDCGKQSKITNANGGKVPNPPNPGNCNFNILMTGDCWRVPPDNNYQCINEQPDANNTPCAGTSQGATNQALPVDD